MQVEDRPFTVIRGCTDKILNYVDNINRPREVMYPLLFFSNVLHLFDVFLIKCC